MVASDAISLAGTSGTAYTFTIIPLGTPLATSGGVYALLRVGRGDPTWQQRSLIPRSGERHDRSLSWSVLYVGQTADLQVRFESILFDGNLARLRATHLAVFSALGESQRRSIEADLVPRYAALLSQPGLPWRRPLVESITIAQRSA